MTEEEKLIALKAMVGGSDSDEVLSTYLKLAGRKIINRTLLIATDTLFKLLATFLTI